VPNVQVPSVPTSLPPMPLRRPLHPRRLRLTQNKWPESWQVTLHRLISRQSARNLSVSDNDTRYWSIVPYFDVSIADFVGQLKSYGMPVWLVDAFGAALAAPIPGDQSSAEIERVLHRKPGTFEQFIKDHRAAFQA